MAARSHAARSRLLIITGMIAGSRKWRQDGCGSAPPTAADAGSGARYTQKPACAPRAPIYQSRKFDGRSWGAMMGPPSPPARQRSRSSPPTPPDETAVGAVFIPRSSPQIRQRSSSPEAAFSRPNFGENCYTAHVLPRIDSCMFGAPMATANSETPCLAVRACEDKSGWYVEAWWLKRPLEKIGRFHTHCDARKWIEFESTSYFVLREIGSMIKQPEHSPS